MKREEAMKLSETALGELADALEQGQSITLTDYLCMLARFHHYSAANVLLIHQQCPQATRVAGFRSWKKLGRHVRKGEKGIVILAPMVRRVNDRRSDDALEVRKENGMHRRSARQVICGFRVAHVFDVSQTEGEQLPEFSTINGAPGVHLAWLKRHVEQLGIQLHYAYLSRGALGGAGDQVIILRPGLQPAEEFAVLVHELAHILLHCLADGATKSTTVRETEAEAIAFVVSQAVGLDTLDHSRDYIHLYRGDRATLMESLDRIRRAASKIIEAVQPSEQAMCA